MEQSSHRNQATGGRQASPASLRRCALCGKKYQVTEPKLVPFCSVRCQQVDLGNWLGEAYGLPWEDPAGGEDLGAFEDD